MRRGASKKSPYFDVPRPPEPPSNGVPINASFARRMLTLGAIKLLKHIRPRIAGILFLTPGICVKYHERTVLAEAATMQFIAEHTSIPVPEVYCAFTHRGRTYIVMERIRGEKLAKKFMPMSVDSKTKILSQLSDMIEAMRRVPAPSDMGVANVVGGSLDDPRLPGLGVIHPEPTPWRFGPFKDIQSFHTWLSRFADDDSPGQRPEVEKLIRIQSQTDWGLPVLTHGDLSSLNILVRNERIVAILDWETAGWYPSYWEYTTAKNANIRNLFWADYTDRFLEKPSDEVLKMEEIRLKYFGI